jgi:acetyl-CoA acetyltransferase
VWSVTAATHPATSTADQRRDVSTHPFRDVAIVAGVNTTQARSLPGHTSVTIAHAAAQQVLAAAGVPAEQVDGVFGERSGELVRHLGIGPVWQTRAVGGISNVIMAASLIASGICSTVLLAEGGAGIYLDRAATAPWTRPSNEYTAPFGMFTAAEFALMARRHMIRYGTTEAQLASVAACIRNFGSQHPAAVYAGRGPFTADDVLASRMVADPFHLLDCSTTSEGGCALLMMSTERAADLDVPAVHLWGGGVDRFGPGYTFAPSWDLSGRGSDVPAGYVGRRAARAAFAMSGLTHNDIDVCEFYDPFSFEIIRQFEAFGFCADGEGGAFVESGAIGARGRYPTTTDGGTMSFSHPGGSTQMLQRVIRGVHQLQGTAAGFLVPDAEVALCSNGGAGALFSEVVLLGTVRP